MRKKPHKVGESAASYTAKKSAVKAPDPKSMAGENKASDDAAFKKVADKIFLERKELLHKLAQ